MIVSSQQVKSNEWYTPARYIEAAREVMGSITLDPASCELANQTVRAARFYSEEENGLLQPWYGNVWLNPPYSSLDSPRGISKGNGRPGPTPLFIAKLVDSYGSREIEQAILCVNADMCRSWFQCLWEYLICFASPAVNFARPHREPEHHFFSTAFVYLGKREQKFAQIFSKFGTIARREDAWQEQ